MSDTITQEATSRGHKRRTVVLVSLVVLSATVVGGFRSQIIDHGARHFCVIF